MFGLLAVGLAFWILGAVVFLAWFFGTPGERGLAAAGAPFAGPLLRALYVVGLAAGFAGRDRPPRSTALRILAPPMAGTAALAAFGDPGLTVDATLDVMKDGAYEYGALYLEVTGGSSGGRVDVMQWLDGDGPPQRAGRHRLRLVWNDLQTDPRASERRLFFEIRQRKEGSEYRPPIREFRIPLSRTP